MKINKTFYLVVFLFSCLFGSLNAQQWVPAGTVHDPGLIPSISVVDANIAWVAGGSQNNPKIFRTSNGGINWVSVTTNGTLNGLQCIWATNANAAIVGEGAINSYARLYKFSSDGTKWNIVLETGQNDGGFNNIIFSRSNPNVGGALADEMYITTNGGNNWVIRPTGVVGVSSAQNSLMLVDLNFFGFGLMNGAARVRMTSDGGVVWSTKNINLTGNYTSGFTFREDKLIGISSTSLSMPYIARTTNGGNTWTTIDIGPGLTGNTIIKWVPGTNVVYILGENGAIKRSINNGLTWVSMPTSGVTGLHHFDFNKVNNIICGYAVSSNGSVIKLADSVLILTNTNSNIRETPTEYKLYQNYPNPFNPFTKIKFRIPSSGYVSLKVYDINGRLVKTIVSGELKPNIYEYVFDAVNLSSGVYFYRIETTAFSDIKRMILVK